MGMSMAGLFVSPMLIQTYHWRWTHCGKGDEPDLNILRLLWGHPQAPVCIAKNHFEQASAASARYLALQDMTALPFLLGYQKNLRQR